MRRSYATASVVVCATVLVGAAIAAASPATLSGTVGPGFSIALRDAQGNAVTRVEPGEFELEVDDRSEEHNFHLRGPGGVDVATDVAGVGRQTFKVTLVNGRYTFVCDPHASTMRGAFDVGTATTPSPTAPTPPVGRPTASVGARLALTVGPGFTISLKTLAGRRVTLLRPGAYTLVVRDRSTIHNARVRGATATRGTGVKFVGTRTWRVVLRKGTLVIQCDPHKGTMRQLVRVA
jgi:plastocyanin